MKTAGFSIIWVGFLFLVVNTTHGEDESKETNFQRPSFTLFNLSSLPTFSLPSFNFLRRPLQGLTNPYRVQSARVTKTEYVEVTRSQTVHPMCYTTYEAVPPCLLRRQDEEFGTDDPEANQYYSNSEKRNIEIQPTKTVPIHMTVMRDLTDEHQKQARFIELITRDENNEFEKRSDVPVLPMLPRLSITETITKTVLINKVERFTDHQITATMLAVNCMPNDRNIPACHSQHRNPIKEQPEGFFADRIQDQENDQTAEQEAIKNTENYSHE